MSDTPAREQQGERVKCEEGKTCPNCGGLHYGSLYCPYTEEQGKAFREWQNLDRQINKPELNVIVNPDGTCSPATQQPAEARNPECGHDRDVPCSVCDGPKPEQPAEVPEWWVKDGKGHLPNEMLWRKELNDAEKRGAEAMRDAIAKVLGDRARAVSLPKVKP